MRPGWRPFLTDDDRYAKVEEQWASEAPAQIDAISEWLTDESHTPDDTPPGMSAGEWKRLLAAAVRERRRRLELDPVAQWRLTPKQQEIDASPKRFRMWSGANRIGKTKLLIWNAYHTLMGTHKNRENSERARVWFCCEDFINHGRPVILPQIFGSSDAVIPDRHIDHWEELERTLYLKNGSVLSLKSYDSGRRKFQSDAIDEIELDEMAPDEIYTECLLRITRPPNLARGRINIGATPLLVPKYYHFYREKGADPNSDYGYWEITLWDNCVENGGYLTRDEILTIINGIEDEAELQTRVYGKAITTMDTIYQKWPELCGDDPPVEWPLYDAIDPSGSGYTAWLCAAAGPRGEIWFIDEYKRKGLDLPSHVEAIKERRAHWIGMGYRFAGTFIDPAANQRDAGQQIDPQTRLWMNVRMQYARLGLPTRLAHNKLVDGIERVKSLIKMGKIKINRRCSELCKERIRYRWDKSPKSSRSQVIGKDDHLMDAMRYICMGPLSPDISKHPVVGRIYTDPGTPQVSVEQYMRTVTERNRREARRMLA